MQSTALVKYPHTELPPLETDQSRLVLAAGGLYRERSSSMFVTSTRLQQRNLPVLVEVGREIPDRRREIVAEPREIRLRTVPRRRHDHAARRGEPLQKCAA